jgi:D-hexose-6-phosphate mutarotase
VSNFIQHTDSGNLYGKPGLDLLLIQTPMCRAVIAQQGAQILEFQTAGREPLLWLSPNAIFEPGQSVRGGIPLCLPWFGVNRKDPSKPKHGLVRTELWQLDSANSLQNGEAELVFTYRHKGSELFAAPFHCTVTMQLGRELKLQLELENLAAETVEYSWAWHSYFPVNDVTEIEVQGLENTEYLDNTRGLERATQVGPLTFPGEVDRVYENASAQQQIVNQSPINTTSENCHTVIAWNPGAKVAATLADVGDHYREYVCVEHGNAFANSWQLEGGQAASTSLVLVR